MQSAFFLPLYELRKAKTVSTFRLLMRCWAALAYVSLTSLPVSTPVSCTVFTLSHSPQAVAELQKSLDKVKVSLIIPSKANTRAKAAARYEMPGRTYTPNETRLS